VNFFDVAFMSMFGGGSALLSLGSIFSSVFLSAPIYIVFLLTIPSFVAGSNWPLNSLLLDSVNYTVVVLSFMQLY
jgi:hypothetical protein